MEIDIADRLRGPARDGLSRLIAGAFRRDGERLEEERKPRFSIPARPSEDDDLVVVAALEAAADEIERLRAALPSSGARASTATAVATAARFARLKGICDRILWSSFGVPSDGPGTKQALEDLCDLMFVDALDKARAAGPDEG